MKLGGDTLKGVSTSYANRHEPESLHLFADIYWAGLLMTGSLIVVGAILYGVWDLTNVLHDLSASSDTSAPPPPALNRTKLEAIINGFDARQEQFDSFRTSAPAGLSDPSR